jgi:sensor domain CHASE-containing protein
MPLKKSLSGKSQVALSKLCNRLVQSVTAIVETDAIRPRHQAPARWDDGGVFVDDLEDMDWEDSSVGSSMGSSTHSGMDGEDR